MLSDIENFKLKQQIQDLGIGIPLEDQQNLFEPFHRANNIGTIPKTGLGLAISKQAVDFTGERSHLTVQLVWERRLLLPYL